MLWGDRVFVATENNGARLISLTSDGSLIPGAPPSHNADFNPDSHTPVASGKRLDGGDRGLQGFEASSDGHLQRVWTHADPRLNEYAFIAAAGRRILTLTHGCELVLWGDAGDSIRELSHLKLKDEDTQTLSAPAFVGTRCFIRIGPELTCLDLRK